jgi:L-fuconolactonase
MEPVGLIDAYCHCGLSKYKPIEDVLETHRRLGVERAVLIQHLGEYDNSYLQEVVRSHHQQAIAVGLIDLRAHDREHAMETLASAREFRGVRVTDQMLKDDLDFIVKLVEHDFVIVIHISTGVADALSPIRNLLERVSRATVVVSHMGKPQHDRKGELADRALLRLADDPRIRVTLSGMSMWCEYPYDPMERFVREVVKAFGAERIMWGTNYSECGTVADCERDLALVTDQHWGLSPEQVVHICYQTAERVWFAP